MLQTCSVRSSTHQRRGPAQLLRHGSAGNIIARRDRNTRNPSNQREALAPVRPTMTSSLTHRHFRRAIWSTKPACLRKPNVLRSIFRFETAASFGPNAAVLSCLYPEPPPPGWCLHAPKAACCVLPGSSGAIQANERSRSILGAPDIWLTAALVDAWRMRFSAN